MRKIVIVLLFVAATGFAQQESSDSEDFLFEAGYGLGWGGLVNDAFTQFLATNGLGAIDPLRLWGAGWRITTGFGGVFVTVENCRTDSYLFGTYGGVQRTRMAWDSTSLSVELGVVTADTLAWRIGAGLLVSKVVVQAYDASGGAFGAVYGSPSTDLVTSWNFSPLLVTSLSLRFFDDTEESMSGWLVAAVEGGWLPFDATWKLFDDPVVTGVPKPFDFFIRPSLWLVVR